MKKSLFLFFVTTAFLISCTKEPHQNFTKINDLDLVEVFQSKSNLLNLSPRNRKIAWIARLNEYKNLDLKPSQVILIDELIKEITDEYGITTVVVTHDMNSVIEIGQKVIFLYKGLKLWEGSNKDITHSGVKELDDFVFANRMMKEFR